MIRPAAPADRDAITAIQRSSPEAASWDPFDYDVTVAEFNTRVVGFLVTRSLTVDEFEVLNLAVDPSWRRRGIARSLLEPWLNGLRGDVFLEVRESNSAARSFYQSLGFKVVSYRPEYYENPRESGIVMKFHSC